jgi:hypothetical protein
MAKSKINDGKVSNNENTRDEDNKGFKRTKLFCRAICVSSIDVRFSFSACKPGDISVEYQYYCEQKRSVVNSAIHIAPSDAPKQEKAFRI